MKVTSWARERLAAALSVTAGATLFIRSALAIPYTEFSGIIGKAVLRNLHDFFQNFRIY
jgi:hypothetical protein